MNPTYWLNLFTYETWAEFLKAGGTVSGFRENRWNTVTRMKTGDILICYLTGISRWIGYLEVTGTPMKDNAPIWSGNAFPARIPVKIGAALEPIHGVPIIEMKDQLSIFNDLKSPHAWTGRVRGSPTKWDAADGQAVVSAVLEAQSNPIEREFDLAKLKKVPPILKASKFGAVTIPEDDAPEREFLTPASNLTAPPLHEPEPKEATAHTEIQWLLLKLGSAMGLDVWVAKNDKSKNFEGKSFSSIPRLKTTLPLQFDEATTRTIELIDVIWLKGNSIQAAFEIESTTSIFSGLLRMSDLITMQPNLNIPLFIVAPNDRQNKVIAEINRPTFASLSPPMSNMCRYIGFEELRKQLDAAKGFVQFLKPEFLDSFSESCEIEEI